MSDPYRVVFLDLIAEVVSDERCRRIYYRFSPVMFFNDIQPFQRPVIECLPTASIMNGLDIKDWRQVVF